ncbi:MAG: DMT family transporter [Phycisphaerae bacterium]|nr:DMT family transporter [Phycisphaerae bacterium]
MEHGVIDTFFRHQGEVYALLTAFVWAFALVLFKRGGETVPPLALNLFKNVVSLTLMAVCLLVLGEGPGTLAAFHRHDLYVLALSGVIGIALADTAFFAALNRIGVGIFSIVDCLYSPFAALFAWLLISERLALPHYIGGALILGGVLLSSKHPPPPGRTRRELITGILLGALSVGMMAFSVVLAKPVLEAEDFPLMWAATIRLGAGTITLLLLGAASPNRKAVASVFRPSPSWRFTVPASVLGSFLSYLLWIAGFKYAAAATVAILNQTSVIFAIILATIVLHEPFTRRKGLAVSLAIAGILVVTFGRQVFGTLSGME